MDQLLTVENYLFCALPLNVERLLPRILEILTAEELHLEEINEHLLTTTTEKAIENNGKLFLNHIARRIDKRRNRLSKLQRVLIAILYLAIEAAGAIVPPYVIRLIFAYVLGIEEVFPEKPRTHAAKTEKAWTFLGSHKSTPGFEYSVNLTELARKVRDICNGLKSEYPTKQIPLVVPRRK